MSAYSNSKEFTGSFENAFGYIIFYKDYKGAFITNDFFSQIMKYLEFLECYQFFF